MTGGPKWESTRSESNQPSHELEILLEQRAVEPQRLSHRLPLLTAESLKVGGEVARDQPRGEQPDRRGEQQADPKRP